MKKVILVLSVLLALAFTDKIVYNDTNILITSESELLIEGKTNISYFKCEFNTNEIKKPIPIYYNVNNDKIVFEKAKLTLDNECFDCGSKGINKDFRALLKTDEYPEIELYLKEVKGDDDSVNALLELFIAGKSQSYFIPLTVSKEDTDHIFVSGVLKLNIADFDLVPPKKVFGLITVSEHIEIDFKLNLIECE